MKHPALKYVTLSGLVFVSAFILPPSWAQLPKRDLTVELRQVEESAGTAYSVSTQAPGEPLAQQSVQVRNGEKASLSVGKSMPMQWIQSLNLQSAMLATSGASASSNSGGVTHAVTWMDAGQTLKVHPVWPGAKQLVTVDIEVESTTVDTRIGEKLPAQSRSQMTTTVRVHLGQWTTIASTGSSLQAGVYGSDATSNTRRLLQIRVQAP